MVDPDRTVFLSYRRDVSWAMASLVLRDLTDHGFDVFMDVQNLDSGEFEHVILAQIAARTHFLVLLEPRSFDRIADEGDWLRREVVAALTLDRNIVPLLVNGAQMPRAVDLPADVAPLPAFNAVSVPLDYFDEAMLKLRDRFLRLPEPVPAGPPADTDVATEERRRPAPAPQYSRAGRPAAPELSAHTIGFGGAMLTWTEVEGATRYELEQSPTADFVQSWKVARGDERLYLALAPIVRQGRWFRVRAVAAGPEHGLWSAPVEIDEQRPAALAPEPRIPVPRLTAVRRRSGVDLIWTAVTGATAYVLQSGESTEFRHAAEVYRGKALRHRDGTPSGDLTLYRIRAERGAAAGPWSEPVGPAGR